MDYPRFFRALREAQELSREQLADRTGCHRNTITNIETGRPVKFATIAEVMLEMGFGPNSLELKQIALLWTEKATGVVLTAEEAGKTADRMRMRYRRTVKEAREGLDAEIDDASLTREDIRLLVFATRHPEARAILRSVADLMDGASDLTTEFDLKVAED